MKPRDLVKAVLPFPARRWLRNQQRRVERARRRVRSGADLGSLRQTTPVNGYDYGEGRGQRIDRYYIEGFLTAHAVDVQGHVLEFFDDSYARKFGGTKVAQVDVLHLTADNPRATIVADLALGDVMSSDTFDCILCTQVLQYVYDLKAAVRTLYRILKPGGVALVTAPGIQMIDRVDMENEGEFWRFTELCLRRLFEEVFPKGQVDVQAYGNVLAAVAFLHGFAVEDLRREDLEYCDPDFEVTISLRAAKPRVV
ncbi:MAG TPA: methyltransferase domain-containing protein [Terriglobia bacterium]|nr:methyltransferase domain-containing protein [Terriglobia bacterium]